MDEEGNVSLPYLDDPIPAAGKSPLQLERDIRGAYLGNRIYRHVSVNVTAPAQSYFIRGEIRSPGRYPLTSGVTIMQAVAAAGGYTDYSSRRRVRLIRDGERTRLNLRSIERNPENDMELRNGDVIIVPRSMF